MNVSAVLAPSQFIWVPANTTPIDDAHVKKVLQQFLDDVATAKRNYGGYRLDLLERAALVAAKKAVRAIAPYGDAGSAAIERIKEVVRDNLLVDRDLDGDVREWLHELCTSESKLNGPSASEYDQDHKTAASGNGSADEVLGRSPARQASDSQQSAANSKRPKSASESTADGPRDIAAKKAGITAADAIVGVRLKAPFVYEEKEGDPREWWQRMILSHPELTHAEKVIGCFWRSCFGFDTGIAFPSLKTIAKATGTGQDTISNTRNKYRALGLLGFNPGRRGRGHSAEYWPCVPVGKPPACGSFSDVDNSPENDLHLGPFEKAENHLKRRENHLKSAENHLHAGLEERRKKKEAREARRAKEGAPACALSRANGHTKAAVKEAQQVINDIVAAAECTIDTFAAQPFENQSNLKRQWRLDPGKARLSPEFMALKAATITTASHRQKDRRQ
jgi:hypothetical protein